MRTDSSLPRRGSLTEDPVAEEVRRVFAALDDVAAMPDPLSRARAISQVLKDQTERNKQFYALRREVVLRLRAQKMPYRKIAAELGVALGTVQDIERGSGRWSSRAKKEDHSPE